MDGDTLVIEFTLNGCVKADFVGAVVGEEMQEIATNASCNHLADSGQDVFQLSVVGTD